MKCWANFWRASHTLSTLSGIRIYAARRTHLITSGANFVNYASIRGCGVVFVAQECRFGCRPYRPIATVRLRSLKMPRLIRGCRATVHRLRASAETLSQSVALAALDTFQKKGSA